MINPDASLVELQAAVEHLCNQVQRVIEGDVFCHQEAVAIIRAAEKFRKNFFDINYGCHNPASVSRLEFLCCKAIDSTLERVADG